MVSNIPSVIENALNNDYDDDIKDFFEKSTFPDGKKLNVVKVNLCYNLDELKQLHKEKQEKIKEKQKIIKYFHKHGLYP